MLATHTATTPSIQRVRMSEPGSEPVQERDRPAGVGEPVNRTPRSETDPSTHDARDRKGEQEIERHGAEAEPERSIRGRQRQQRVAPGDPCERIED